MAFCWAAAVEEGNPRIGTRGLFVGAYKAKGSRGELAQLLDFFGIPEGQLFDALQRAYPRVQIKPRASAEITLTTLPTLTENAEQVLEQAVQLQTDTNARTELVYVVYALLQVNSSTTYKALTELLEPAKIRTASEALLEYMHEGPRSPFGEFLETRFPSAAPPKAAPAPQLRQKITHDPTYGAKMEASFNLPALEGSIRALDLVRTLIEQEPELSAGSWELAQARRDAPMHSVSEWVDSIRSLFDP